MYTQAHILLAAVYICDVCRLSILFKNFFAQHIMMSFLLSAYTRTWSF